MDRIIKDMCNREKLTAYQIMEDAYNYINEKNCESEWRFLTLKAFSFNQALQGVNEYYYDGYKFGLTKDQAVEVQQWAIELLKNNNIDKSVRNGLAKTRVQTSQSLTKIIYIIQLYSV